MKTYDEIQQEESKTWLVSDPAIFADKKQREIARYPMIAKQMGLSVLDTSHMTVFDVGAGPFGGVSSVLVCYSLIRFDPLKSDYSQIADTSSYQDTKAEDIDYSPADLVIATNCIDHYENPEAFFKRLVATMKPGAYFAHYHAIDNAITHPHPAHVWNINPEMVHRYLDTDFETVWEMKYPEVRYGWVQYHGKVGQPAFTGLFRKTTGYK